MRSLLLLAAAAVFLLATAPGARPAAAATPPWPASSYSYYATGQSVQEVLQDFGRSFGVRVQVSPAVDGLVDGRFFAETPSQFLDTLANTYGLTWYYHGGTLYVHAATETVSRSVDVASDDLPAVREALSGLGVLDDKFGWGAFPERGAVIVSGPPSYVSLVERTVRMLPGAPARGMGISVFRLKHAAADDRTFFYRDRQVTVPGVATILSNLVNDGGGTVSGLRNEPVRTPLTTSVGAGGALGSGLPPIIVGGGDAVSTARATDAAAPAAAGRGAVATESAQPVIQADTRLNAVIIKDYEERLASYERLIALLDVPTALIEIEAAVIDVNTSNLADLGIRWQGRNGNVAGGFGTIESAQPTDQALSIALGAGANLQTILAGASSYFLAQVSALEAQGKASVLSQPTVLTLDNLEAVLDLSETFYIPVEGENVADVVPVSAGVLLKVTPRLVSADLQERIQMVVDIEDGTILREAQVAQLPTVRRSTISTQAVVESGQSLLIGGYYFETEVENEEAIPLLGDIPLLGLLFSRTETQAQKRERLFLITPRIIQVPGT